MPSPPHIGISNLFTPEKVKNTQLYYKKHQLMVKSQQTHPGIEPPFDSKSADHWKV
jgi:hypothetical protein